MLKVNKSLARPTTLAILLGLAGCGAPDLSDLETYAMEIKMRRSPPMEPLPEFILAETFQYQARQRRDPFVPDRETAASIPAPPDPGGPSPDPLRPRESLERFALDSLVMQGILQRGNDIWALILAKEDKSLHRVTIGNHLGQHHGRIVHISEQGIDLIELVQDGAGLWRERDQSLTLVQAEKR